MRYFLFACFAMALCGCNTLMNTDKLLQVKSLSDNQAAQQKLVEAQNKKFEALVAVVKNDRLAEYPDQESIRKAFGEPIFLKTFSDDEAVKEKWMYRYSEKIMGSEKVYLYFDSSGKLIDHKYVAPPPKPTGAPDTETTNAAEQKT